MDAPVIKLLIKKNKNAPNHHNDRLHLHKNGELIYCALNKRIPHVHGLILETHAYTLNLVETKENVKRSHNT